MNCSGLFNPILLFCTINNFKLTKYEIFVYFICVIHSFISKRTNNPITFDEAGLTASEQTGHIKGDSGVTATIETATDGDKYLKLYIMILDKVGKTLKLD